MNTPKTNFLHIQLVFPSSWITTVAYWCSMSRDSPKEKRATLGLYTDQRTTPNTVNRERGASIEKARSATIQCHVCNAARANDTLQKHRKSMPWIGIKRVRWMNYHIDWKLGQCQSGKGLGEWGVGGAHISPSKETMKHRMALTVEILFAAPKHVSSRRRLKVVGDALTTYWISYFCLWLKTRL